MTDALDIFIADFEPVKRGRKPINATAMTSTERSQKTRSVRTKMKAENIAILDMETDPFDAENNGSVAPFLAVLYSDNFDPIIIWEEDEPSFVHQVITAIEGLPDAYTIYAHNGGKFDFMFLVRRIRGRVSFKGRGIMAAKIGAHELRDSFHIIPEKLANYQKDSIDYTKMRKGKRNKYRQEIIDYCLGDCRYLLDIVKRFVRDYGLKLSIGQAAMYELKQKYKVNNLTEGMDKYLRQYFFGGRVECLAGKGKFDGHYKLYDVNSMYPYVMSNYQHPIGSEYQIRYGFPGPNTVFIQLECDNFGALVKRGENNETSANFERGEFFTTIWEYETARKYGLISNIRIKYCVDCKERTDFREFVVPLYSNRLRTKDLLKSLQPGSYEFNEAKKDDIFTKLLLNNAYGKFAQNPRRFKESYITEPDENPPEDAGKGFGDLPAYRCGEYAIWERPSPNRRFNNVGTAASITGAARAVLMEAIFNAVDPIYCDTDSLICKELNNHVLHPTELGAWDLEAEYSEVIITGKKQYACKDIRQGKEIKIRSKGVSGLEWKDFEKMLEGEVISVLNKGVTMTKKGDQYYMRRSVRATAPQYAQKVFKHANRGITNVG